jgi:hypothetical protein
MCGRSARIASGSRRGHEQIVTGFGEAQRTADALAERLG